jgi:hypothetical protein
MEIPMTPPSAAAAARGGGGGGGGGGGVGGSGGGGVVGSLDWRLQLAGRHMSDDTTSSLHGSEGGMSAALDTPVCAGACVPACVSPQALAGLRGGKGSMASALDMPGCTET